MANKRKIYWISQKIGDVARRRARLLDEKGYETAVFTNLDQLLEAFSKRRAATLIIGDEGPEWAVRKMISSVMSLPELQATRKVLISSQPERPWAKYLAACGGFRDVIPDALSDREWFQRLHYATASQPITLSPPSAQITLNHISAAALPARVTWVSEDKLRLESRISPPVGATLQLTGRFAQDFGVQSLTLKVRETQRSRLMFRFSDAVVAEWSLPDHAKDSRDQVLARLGEESLGPRCRVFLAVSSPELRDNLFSMFDDPRFEINAALRKHALVEEPRYFTPDVVIIEEKLVTEDLGAHFSGMLEELRENATVIVIGERTRLPNLKAKFPGRRFVILDRVNGSLPEAILTRYLPPSERKDDSADDGAHHIPAEHPYSLAELSLPARLTSIHPEAGGVALPYPVGAFGLCRLEAPLLRKISGRTPWVKVTGGYTDTRSGAAPFAHRADFIFADATPDERAHLAQNLSRILNERYQEYARGKPASPAAAPKTEKSPDRWETVSGPAVPLAPPGRPEFPKDPQDNGEDSPDGERVAAASGDDTAGAPPKPRKRKAPLQAKPKVAKKAAKPDPLTALLAEPTLKHILGYLAVIGFFSALIYLVMTVVAPQWERGGKEYTEQLKKFAPHINEPDQ